MSAQVRGVRTAIMPQPMSTPTAAGMMAPFVGMQEPTVAPSPKWQSGMTATWPKMNGIFDMFSIWARAFSSICSDGTHVRARLFIWVGMFRPPWFFALACSPGLCCRGPCPGWPGGPGPAPGPLCAARRG